MTKHCLFGAPNLHQSKKNLHNHRLWWLRHLECLFLLSSSSFSTCPCFPWLIQIKMWFASCHYWSVGLTYVDFINNILCKNSILYLFLSGPLTPGHIGDPLCVTPLAAALPPCQPGAQQAATGLPREQIRLHQAALHWRAWFLHHLGHQAWGIGS